MDKLYHLITGFLICLVTGLACFYLLDLSASFSKGTALLMSFAAGIFKECFDCIRAKKWDKTTWDMFDFLSTCAGGFAGIFILIVGFQMN